MKFDIVVFTVIVPVVSSDLTHILHVTFQFRCS